MQINNVNIQEAGSCGGFRFVFKLTDVTQEDVAKLNCRPLTLVVKNLELSQYLSADGWKDNPCCVKINNYDITDQEVDSEKNLSFVVKNEIWASLHEGRRYDLEMFGLKKLVPWPGLAWHGGGELNPNDIESFADGIETLENTCSTGNADAELETEPILPATDINADAIQDEPIVNLSINANYRYANYPYIISNIVSFLVGCLLIWMCFFSGLFSNNDSQVGKNLPQFSVGSKLKPLSLLGYNVDFYQGKNLKKISRQATTDIAQSGDTIKALQHAGQVIQGSGLSHVFYELALLNKKDGNYPEYIEFLSISVIGRNAKAVKEMSKALREGLYIQKNKSLANRLESLSEDDVEYFEKILGNDL